MIIAQRFIAGMAGALKKESPVGTTEMYETILQYPFSRPYGTFVVMVPR